MGSGPCEARAKLTIAILLLECSTLPSKESEACSVEKPNAGDPVLPILVYEESP